MPTPPSPQPPQDTEPPTAWQDLLARARGGDASALEVMLRRAQPHLEAYAARTLGEWMRAHTRKSDILQDAMLEVLQHLDEFSGSTEATFVRWVERIVDNRARQQYRHLTAQRRRPPSSPSSLGDLARVVLPEPRTPSSLAGGAESGRLYELALATLSDDQRRVIVGVVVDGRPVAEVAAELGRTTDAVYALLNRARAALAVRLGRDADNGPR